MGYNTRYTLKWGGGDSRPACEHEIPANAKFCPECGKAVGEVLIDELIGNDIDQNDNASYALTRRGDCKESCSWYEHERFLIDLSEHYPDVLFTLSGVGEDAGDLWRKYFMNGRVQLARAVIAYPTFTPELLKKP